MECPNKLFYTRKKEYANQQGEDSFLQSLAEGGFQVEELARLHYPGGELISGNDGDYDWLVEETNKLLKRKDVIIYEAAFKFENLFIRTDILVKKGNDIELIEVKAKSFHSDDDEFVSSNGKITSNWRPYLYDLAFQKHVIIQSYPQWKVSAFLMLADKSKTASIDGLNQLFRITSKADNRTGIIMPPGLTLKDTGKSVLSLAPMDELLAKIYSGTEAEDDYTFFELVKTLSEHYKKDKKFNYPVGWHCKGCEFKKSEGDDSSLKSGFEECWKEQKKWKPAHFAKPKTFELWDFRKGSKLFEEQGKIFLDQLTEEDVDVKPAPGRISRTERQWILHRARDAVLLGDLLAGDAHVEVVVDVPQAVPDHRVDQLAVAEAHARARFRQQVRRVAHALHAAGDDHFGIARADRLGREHHALEARAADLVDREGADAVGNPGLARRLTSGVLAEPRLQHVAHDHLLDGVGRHARAAQGLGDGERSEIRRPEAREGALELGDRGTTGTDEDDFLHGWWSSG